MKSGHRHPGITYHKLPVGGDVGGMIAGVGIVIGAWIGLPDYRWFWIASGIGGVMIGVSLYIWHKRSKPEVGKLSIRPPQ